MRLPLHILALCLTPLMTHAHHSPFGGTVHTLPEMITADDPSTLTAVTFLGEVENEIWDHKVEEEFLVDAWAFRADFTHQTSVIFHANMSYGDFDIAEYHVKILAHIMGQMPRVCRSRTDEIDVNPTGDDWSASPGEMTIDMGALDQEALDGTLEESMMHECVHTSLDEDFEDDRAWHKAQRADRVFISDYAEENPASEDLAETITLYWGLLFHPERFDDELTETIRDTVPNRLKYLERNLPKRALRR